MSISWPNIRNQRLAQNVVQDVLEAADPIAATEFCLRTTPGTFFKRDYFLAVGKAAVASANALALHYPKFFKKGLVLTTPQHEVPKFPESIEVLIADHPLPTERNLVAADRAQSFVSALSKQDRLFVFLSGGGSALLTLPVPSIAVHDLVNLTERLQRAGCPIDELNCVRKHCEFLKGGQLGSICPAKAVFVNVISDVIGDDVSTVASGPFSPDPSTYAQALDVLMRYSCKCISPAIDAHLLRGASGNVKETPKPGDSQFDRTYQRILLNNNNAIDAAIKSLQEYGLDPAVLRQHTGESCDAAQLIAQSLHYNSAVVLGGEPVVSGIPKNALGGPMQEAVLATALELENANSDWLVIGFATDGIDGPTDAAGAAIDSQSLKLARKRGLNIEHALHTHNSYPLLADLGALIKTGPTGTNINDVLIAVRNSSNTKQQYQV
jgi:glycerate 2-kinase